MPIVGAGAASGAAGAEHAAVTIVPNIVEREVAAGEQFEVRLEVLNQSPEPARVRVGVQDLEPSDEPDAISEPVAAGSTRLGAGGWLRAPEQVLRIPSADRHVLELRGAVPDQAGPGGHYAAVTLQLLPPPDAGEVVVEPEVVVPLLFTVAGPVERDLHVELEAEVDRPVVWRAGPLRWRVRLENRGTVHEVTSGSLEVDGRIGGGQARPLPPLVLLPGAVRTATVESVHGPGPDLVAARVEVVDATGTPVAAAAPRVWIVPWWLPVTAGVLLLLVAWRIRVLRSRRTADL